MKCLLIRDLGDFKTEADFDGSANCVGFCFQDKTLGYGF